MQKIYRCPACQANMEYMPDTGMMYCAYCGSSYPVEEVSEEREETVAPADQGKVREERTHATMKMQILTCKACGAELAVNDVEVSSFCAYCGQATVVLDRVDEYLRPDYVMPFSVAQDRAEQIIREKITAGFYVPNEIKHFEIEKLRGIYVPFWLYDLYYGDEQYYKYTVKRGKSTVTRYSHRVADSHYHKLTLDASKNLNDYSSQRLEPYHMDALESFQPMYLSGFYADRFDMGVEDTKDLAVSRAKGMFDEVVAETVKHSGAKRVYTKPVSKVTDVQYALLPAWFLTFRNEGLPYTILVNGQTGKMVGAVPYVKAKAYATFGILAAILCAILAPLGGIVTRFILTDVLADEDGFKAVIMYFIFAGLAIFMSWSTAWKKHQAFRKSVELTRSGVTSRFVKERQDR